MADSKLHFLLACIFWFCSTLPCNLWFNFFPPFDSEFLVSPLFEDSSSKTLLSPPHIFTAYPFRISRQLIQDMSRPRKLPLPRYWADFLGRAPRSFIAAKISKALCCVSAIESGVPMSTLCTGLLELIIEPHCSVCMVGQRNVAFRMPKGYPYFSVITTDYTVTFRNNLPACALLLLSKVNTLFTRFPPRAILSIKGTLVASKCSASAQGVGHSPLRLSGPRSRRL